MPAIKELKKCVVVCHNCHGEIHEGLIEKTLIEEKHEIFKNKLGQFDGKEWTDILNHFDSVKEKYEQEVNRIKTEGRKRGDIRIKRDLQCLTCGVKIERYITKGRGAYCKEHLPISQPKIDWPSDEELGKLVNEKPMKILAKELGVSDRTIAKRCNKRKIQKPIKKFMW